MRGLLSCLGFCLLAGQAWADEVTPITLGQAVWREQATVTVRRDASGSPRQVQVDLFGLVLDQPGVVRIGLRTDSRLGVIVYDLDRSEGGDPRSLGVVGPGLPKNHDLAAGRYLLAVAGDPPSEGAYLLSVTAPEAPAASLVRLAEPVAGSQPRCTGAWQLPRPVRDLAVSADGQLVASSDGTTAWLHDLAAGASYRLSTEPGEVRRVAFSPDGWSVLTVTAGGARLLSLPDRVPFASFVAAGGTPVADAVYLGAGQHLAVLPERGAVYLTSPVPGDLAFLPRSEGAALAADAHGARLAVADRAGRLAVFDTATRRQLAAVNWPAAPRTVSLHPEQPLLAAVMAGAAQVWRVGPDPTSSELAGATAAVWSPGGSLFYADDEGVKLVTEGQPRAMQPVVLATHLACSADGEVVAAVDAEGRLVCWATAAGLDDARVAYVLGLQAYRDGSFAEAELHFSMALGLLQRQEQSTANDEVVALILLRLSQTHFNLKQYEQSLSAAEALLEVARRLPDGETKTGYLGIGEFRAADALWELGRRAEAKPRYQRALDTGLDGGRAEDARQRLAEP